MEEIKEEPFVKVAPGHWFKKGNKIGSRGRPTRECERNYLDATIGICTIEIWREITKKAIERAINGDQKAVDWLSKIIIGNLDAVQVVIQQTKSLDELSQEIQKKLQELEK